MDATTSSSKEVQDLAREVRHLRALLRVQAHKTLLMHRALVAGGVLGPAALDSPTAEAAPVVQHQVGSQNLVMAFGSKGQGIFSRRPELSGTLVNSGADCLFFRDFLQAWWFHGLLGISQDVPSTVAYLRGRIEGGGYRRVVTTGTSMGAYAAILFGVLLGVERIVAFAPQTQVNQREFDYFGGTDAKEMNFNFRSHYTDLAKVLGETPYTGRIDIYFGERSGYDEKHARHLEGFDCVRLHSLDSDDHNPAALLKQQGRLDALFRFDD